MRDRQCAVVDVSIPHYWTVNDNCAVRVCMPVGVLIAAVAVIL